MEKHHSVWHSAVGTLSFFNHVIKAAKSRDEEELLRAIINAYRNWPAVEETAETIREYFHHHKLPQIAHEQDYLTDAWVASDSHKTDYINQNGNIIIYATNTANGYRIYFGHLVTNYEFVLVGHNSRSEKVVIVGEVNNNLSSISMNCYIANSSQSDIRTENYYLERDKS